MLQWWDEQLMEKLYFCLSEFWIRTPGREMKSNLTKYKCKTSKMKSI